MTNYKTTHRFDFTKKHHAEIWKAMKAILDDETHTATLNDEELSEAIKAKGIWATAIIVRNVRLEHEIGNADERIITNYSRDFKAGKIKK